MSAVPWAILSFLVLGVVVGWARMPRERPLRLMRSRDGFVVRGGFHDVTWTSDARGAQLCMRDVGGAGVALVMRARGEWGALDSARAEQLLRNPDVQHALAQLWVHPAVLRVELDDVLRVRCAAIDDATTIHALLRAADALGVAVRACVTPAIASGTVSASSSPVAVSSLRRG
jgi:hypothetical protein